MAKVKDGRGGARPNSGPKKKPPDEYSDSFKRSIMRSLKKIAKEKGFASPYDALAELALSSDVQDTVRLGAWKILADVNVVKAKTLSIVQQDDRPKVYLPEPMAPPRDVQKVEDKPEMVLN